MNVSPLKHLVRRWSLIFAAALLALCTGCGGNGALSTSSPPPPPSAPKLTSLQVSASNTNLIVGQTEQLTATGKFSDNSTKDLTGSVSWQPSSAALASISSKGILTAQSSGLVSITASLDSVTSSLNFTIAPKLVSISVTPATATIALATKQQFAAAGTFSDGSVQNLTASVSWSSSDPAVAAISNTTPTKGLTVAALSGNATIIAALGSVSSSASLSVTPAKATSISISPNPATMTLFISQQFKAMATFTDGTTQDITNVVTWSSSSAQHATVTGTGLVTPKQTTATSTGTDVPVNITASFEQVSATASVSINAANLLSISIQSVSPSIAQGTRNVFTATGTFNDGSTHNVTPEVAWSSPSDPSSLIVRLSSGGVAFGVAPGTVTITATLGSISASVPFTITNATIQSIEVTPTSHTVPIGWHQTFTATGVFSDSSTQDITNAVQWQTNNANAVTVSNTSGNIGLAVAVASGTATITANFSYAGASASGTSGLTVSSYTLQSLSVTPNSTLLAPGASQQYTATGTWSDGSSQILNEFVSWSASDISGTNVAIVGGPGSVTGESAGSATITAQFGTLSASSTVLVEGSPLSSLQVTSQDNFVPQNFQITYKAMGTFADGNELDLTSAVTWTSSASSVATVSNVSGTQGIATGLAVGSTVISAAFQGQGASATLTVTNATLNSIVISPATATISLGGFQQFAAKGTFSDNSTISIMRQVVWTSSNPAVAVIGTGGFASSTSSGTTTIRANLMGISGTAILTVQ